MSCLRTFGVAAVASVAAAQDVFLAARQLEAEASGVANATERALDVSSFSGEIRWAGRQNVCLDLAGGRQDNGNKLQAWQCTGSANQKFLYNPYEEHPQIKLAANPSKCLDVYDGGSANFANVVLWDCHPLGHPDREHQAFVVGYSGFGPMPTVVPVSYSTQIQWAPLYSKCLDLNNGVVGSPSESNSKVITYDCHSVGEKDNDHQQWVFNDGSASSRCAIQLSSDACTSTPQCEWCNRYPPACYNSVQDPTACSN